jgi:hypothetical protein
MWDHFHWFSYQIIFPSIYGSSKTKSVCDMDVRFTTHYSWSPKWSRTWFGLGLQLGLDALGCLLRWWPSKRHPWASLSYSPSFWGMLQFEPRSQVGITNPRRRRSTQQKQRQNVSMIWRPWRHDIEVGLDLFKSLSNKLSIKCSLTSIALRMDELW